MDIHETDTVLRLWCANIMGGPSPADFMCLIVTDGKELRGEYRMRYHAGPGLDAPDKFSRFELDPAVDTPAERERMFQVVRNILQVEVLGRRFTDVVEKPINGDWRALKIALLEVPGLQTRISTVEIPK